MSNSISACFSYHGLLVMNLSNSQAASLYLLLFHMLQASVSPSAVRLAGPLGTCWMSHSTCKPCAIRCNWDIPSSYMAMRPWKKPSRGLLGCQSRFAGSSGAQVWSSKSRARPFQPLLRRRLIELGLGQVLGIHDVPAEHGNHVLAANEPIGGLV